MKNYEIIKVDISTIKPYDKNARVHNAEQIKQIMNSIKEFGFTNPLLIDSNRNLIAGHGRLEALQQLNKLEFKDNPIKEVNAVIIDGLSEAQKRALIIADNKIAENAFWDDELLKSELLELDNLGFDLDLVGFNDSDLNEILMDNDENTRIDNFEFIEANNNFKAPLPFQGQKRFFLKYFIEILKEFPDDAIYLDLFGGSGLLSRTIKDNKPNAQVVWNDFDNYELRLKNIDITNELVERIYEIIEYNKANLRVTPQNREAILNLCFEYEKQGKFVDYKTLSALLLFSGNFACNYDEFSKSTFYFSGGNKKKYYSANGYLDGLIIERDDFLKIYKKYEKNKNVVLVLDPPYLYTDISSYTADWNIDNFISLLQILQFPYILFSSSKSKIIDFLKVSSSELPVTNIKDFIVKKVKNKVNFASEYDDLMIYKANNA